MSRLCGIPLVLLSACATAPATVERRVEVPVEITRVIERPVLPPDELLRPVPLPQDIWLPPTAADASSCVAPPGEDALLRYVSQQRAREEALGAWARQVR